MLKKERLERKKERNKQFDNFDILIDEDNLEESFRKCCKGVKWKYSVQKYKSQLLVNIMDTKYRLMNKLPITKPTRPFTISERGKVRHIHSIHIYERVVQKCLCDNILVPILSKTLINDNGASLKGKGISFTRKRLVRHLSEFYRKYGNNGYILTIDFKKYFQNINHDILIRLLNNEIKDERIMDLIKQILSTFGKKGLYLGSQVSQIFAIFYANPLDHFIKEKLGVRYYGRYMDDSYIIANSLEDIYKYLKNIREICKKLDITINESKVNICKLSKGFNFLKGKYRITTSGRIIKKINKKNIKRQKNKLKKLKNLLLNNKITYNDIRITYSSLRGYLKHFDHYKIMCNFDNLYYKLFFNGERICTV